MNINNKSDWYISYIKYVIILPVINDDVYVSIIMLL